MLSLRSLCIGAISTNKSLYHIDESIMVLSAGSQMKACRLNSPRVLLPTVIGFGLDSLYAGARACGTCRPQIRLRNVLQQASREVSQGSPCHLMASALRSVSLVWAQVGTSVASREAPTERIWPVFQIYMMVYFQHVRIQSTCC